MDLSAARSAHLDGVQPVPEAHRRAFAAVVEGLAEPGRGGRRCSITTGATRSAVAHWLGTQLDWTGAGSVAAIVLKGALLAGKGMGLDLTAQLVEQAEMARGVELAKQGRIPGH